MRSLEPRPRTFYFLLGFLTVIAFGYSEWVTWTQFLANRIGLLDAGIFDVLCAGPRHGYFLRSPFNWDIEGNFFGNHFMPILFPLMGLYFIADHIMTMLTVFNLALAAAAIPLALWTSTRLESRLAGLLVAFAYLANHFTGSIHLANHPESLGLVGVFTAILGFERRSPWLCAAGCVWALCVKEDYAFWIVLLGLAFLGEPGGRKWGIWTIAGGVAWGILALAVIRLNGYEAFRQAGNAPMAKIATALGDPLALPRRVLSVPLLVVFASVAFLPLLDWRRFWLPFLGVAPFLATGETSIGQLNYYYAYAVLPFLFYTAVRGIEVLGARFPSCQASLRLGASGLLAAIGLLSLLLPTRTDGHRRVPFEVTERHRVLSLVLDTLPPDAPVAVQSTLFTRVPNRAVKLPLRARYLDRVDYVLMDEFSPMSDLAFNTTVEEKDRFRERLTRGDMLIEFQAEGYLLLRREVSPSVQDDDSPNTPPGDGDSP